MLEQLVNLKDYTPLELLLFAGGCYVWVVVYIIYMKNIHQQKCIGMPVFAAAGNVAWEFVWGWIPPYTDMGPLLVWAYRIWFIFDLYIFYGVVRYGADQVINPAIKQYFRPLIVITAIGWGIIIYFFKKEGFDTPIGANSAYIAQMFISVLYVLLLLRHPKYVWFSAPVAWLKMIGTGTNTIFMLMHYDSHFLHTLAVMSLIVDNVYIYLFYRARANNAIEG